MTDLATALTALRRPSLMIRAARHGQADYHRTRDLARLIDADTTPPPRDAVRKLLAEEELLEATRKSDGLGYSLARHIDILVALMAEAQFLRRGEPS